MKKYLILGLFTALVLSLAFVPAGKPNLTRQSVDVIPSNGHATVVIPARAIEVAPGVFSLGTAIDNGRVVEGYAIVDYKKAPGKPGTSCGNGVCEPGENARKCPEDCGGSDPEPDSTCYGFLSKGAKWKSAEAYVVNPANVEGLDEGFVASNLEVDITKWEDAAGTDILGDGSVTSDTLVADMTSPDDKNEVYFGDISDPGAIGITIVWGIFRGPPSGRELVEWDQIYDQADYDWSASGEAGKMDFESIATHELGHSVGLDDLYTAECSDQTMYGYASEGETNKRTLEDGDIAGVSELYA